MVSAVCIFSLLGNEQECTAPVSAALGQEPNWRAGREQMDKENRILHYSAVLAVFRTWIRQGWITDSDFRLLEAKMAERYGLSNNSIYRQTP